MTLYSNFFSYIPFWLQQYITTHLKTNLILGSMFFFSRYRLLNRQPIFNFAELKILLNFGSLHIY